LKKKTPFRLFGALLIATYLPLVGSAQEQAAKGSGCRLNNGQAIRVQATPTLPDIAAASFDRFTGTPVIFFNPWAVSRLPPAFREFVHAHECAHHHLDHLRTGPVGSSDEAEADCWAAAELTALGVLSPSDIVVVSNVLTALLPGDRTHASGHLRATELQRCVRYARMTAPGAVSAITSLN
jgi:hypothetical protein